MERHPEHPIDSYRELALFLGLAVPALIFTMFAVHSAVLATPLKTWSKPVQLVVPQLAGYAAVLVVLASMLRARGESFSRSLRLAVPAALTATSVALGMGIAIGSVAVAALLRTPRMDSPMEALLLEDPVTMAIAAVTMAPVCEEILFRGVLQPLLVRDIGVAGILLTAAAFGLLHGAEYSWSWRHLLIVSLVGVSFGWIRYETGSTGASALAHAIYNGMLMVFYFIGRMLS